MSVDSFEEIQRAEMQEEMRQIRNRRIAFWLIGLGSLVSIGSSWWAVESAHRKTDKILIQTEEIEKLKTASEYIESGRSFYDMHQYGEAIFEYRKAIEADSQNAVAHHLLAYSLYLTKDYEKAREAVEKAISLSSDGPWIHYNAILIYWALNDKEKMLEQIRDLKRVEDMNNSDRMIKVLKKDTQFRKIKKLPEVKAIIGE